MTTGRRWPAATDYIDAVQHPAHVFSRAELMDVQFDLDLFGIPDGCTGSNAIVFKATLAQRTAALRCFTSQAGLSRERYLALARHWTTEPERRHWMVPATWWDDALKVKGEQWPLVEMDWITGRPLDMYVGFLCEQQPDVLHVLATSWREMLADLSAARVADGDLQHGNVLVDQVASLRLVDLDSAWVPGMDGLAPLLEAGHQAFRHPNRPRTHAWDQHMDVFPGLVVLTSLKALAHQPRLWTTYNNGDNLIFTAEDFAEVDRTPLWSDLSRINEREVADLVLLLKQCCDASWQPTVPLESLLETGVALPPSCHKPAATAAAPPDDVRAEPELDLGLPWPVALPQAAAVPAVPVEAAVFAAAPAPQTASLHERAATLPPPPPASCPVLHAPVAIEVPIAPTPGGGHSLFGPPTLGTTGSKAFGPGPTSTGRRTKMARGFAGWAIAAFVLNWVFGIPMLIMARRAARARSRGEMEKAIRVCTARAAWSIAIVVVSVALAVLIAAGRARFDMRSR